MTRSITAAGVAGALALLSTGLSGQTPLAVGQTVSGTLAESAPTTGDFGRAIAYQLRLRAGERIVASMASEAFDSYLSITRPGEAEALESDDDGGGDLNARLRFTAPAAGTYLLLAQSFAEDGVGDGHTSATITEKRRDQSPAGSRPARRVYVWDHGRVAKVLRADLPPHEIASGRKTSVSVCSGAACLIDPPRAVLRRPAPALRVCLADAPRSRPICAPCPSAVCSSSRANGNGCCTTRRCWRRWDTSQWGSSARPTRSRRAVRRATGLTS